MKIEERLLASQKAIPACALKGTAIYQSYAASGCPRSHRSWGIALAAIGAVAIVLFACRPLIIKAQNQARTDSINNRRTDPVLLQRRSYFAKKTYNKISENDESLAPVEISQAEEETFESSDPEYSGIRVHSSFAFDIVSPSSFAPYFSEDLLGEKITLVVARIEICVKTGAPGGAPGGAWYGTEMVMLKYENELQGFLGGNFYLINDNFYKYPTSDPENDPYNDIYQFETATFLTANKIMTVDNVGDMTYGIQVKAKDKKAIKIKVNSTYTKDYFYTETMAGFHWIDYPDVYGTFIEGSYRTLSAEETIDLIQESLIGSIETSAIISNIDIYHNLIDVVSMATPSLKQIFPAYGIAIPDETNGTTLHFIDLKVGDALSFSYFRRYQGYQPQAIYLEKIRVTAHGVSPETSSSSLA